VVVVVDVVVEVLVVTGPVVLVELLDVVDVVDDAVLDVVELVVVVTTFALDGTHSSLREMIVTSRCPNWLSIVCFSSPKRADSVL
jgi:hypothetical protein